MKETKPIEPWQAEDAARLKRLFDAREPKISQMEFGERYEIGSQGMVWQYITGRRPLNIKAASAFARGLGVTLNDISPKLAAQVTEAAATTSTPVNHAASKSASLPQPGPTYAIPVLQWVTAEEAALLSDFRATDERGRDKMLRTARTVVKIQSPNTSHLTASNEH